MALNIEWSSEADRNLKAIFDYLERMWSEREISNFAKKLESNLQHISKNPATYPYYDNACKHFNQVFVPQRLQRVHIIFPFYPYHNTSFYSPNFLFSMSLGCKDSDDFRNQSKIKMFFDFTHFLVLSV